MSVNVRLSLLLQECTNKQELVEVEGNTAMDCIQNLMVQFPSLRRWLYDKQGGLWSGVLFFVNGESIHADELARALNDSDEMSVMLPIAGG